MSSIQSQTIDLANRLFIEHSLINYSFGFDRAVRRAGQCDFRARRITISKHLVNNCTLEEIEQVILHEIAHALVGKEAGHSKLWKSRQRKLATALKRSIGKSWLPVLPATPAAAPPATSTFESENRAAREAASDVRVRLTRAT